MIYVGIDDTDTATSRGTGALARQVAAALSTEYRVMGVLRHQLLRDPRVPCTRNNSAKAILLEGDAHCDLAALAAQVEQLMLADFIEGSDPGLCVVGDDVPEPIVDFGRRAQRELLIQNEARALAAQHKIYLAGLGGDEGGVIGALAAVGLTAAGEHGRYIELGAVRGLVGLQPVETVLAAGVAAVLTAEGREITDGLVLTDCLRPARRGGTAVAVVERAGDHWRPLKLD